MKIRIMKIRNKRLSDQYKLVEKIPVWFLKMSLKKVKTKRVVLTEENWQKSCLMFQLIGIIL